MEVEKLNKKSNSKSYVTADERNRPGWSFILILAGVVTTLGLSLPVGYNIGVVNTPADTIKAFCNESLVTRYNVTLDTAGMNVLWSAIVSIFVVGGCTGSLMGAWLADSMGRKGAAIAISAMSFVASLIFTLCKFANSVEMIILGRLLVGLAGGLTTSIVPMYLSELAPSRLTGALGVICPLGVNFGVLVAQLMGLDFLLGKPDQWPYLLAFYGILVVVSFPVLLILPESPKYLFAIKKDQDAALTALSRTRGISASLLVDEVSLIQIESASEAACDTNWTLWRVLKDPNLRIPLLLVCSMQAGQQTSGINAVFNYSYSIFMAGGLSSASSQYATIGCGAINCFTAIVVIYLFQIYNRRTMLLGSIAAAVISLTALAISLQFIKTITWMPYLCMVAVLLYVFVYGFGLGPIPYFIAAEMFEVGPRPGAMALGSLCNWVGNFAVAMSFPTLKDAIGPYCFVLYATLTAALFVFQKLYFYETKGRSPTQVSEHFSKRN